MFAVNAIHEYFRNLTRVSQLDTKMLNNAQNNVWPLFVKVGQLVRGATDLHEGDDGAGNLATARVEDVDVDEQRLAADVRTARRRERDGRRLAATSNSRR